MSEAATATAAGTGTEARNRNRDPQPEPRPRAAAGTAAMSEAATATAAGTGTEARNRNRGPEPQQEPRPRRHLHQESGQRESQDFEPVEQGQRLRRVWPSRRRGQWNPPRATPPCAAWQRPSAGTGPKRQREF